MAERRISEGEVEQTLANYYVSYPDRDGSLKYISNIDNRRIRVAIPRIRIHRTSSQLSRGGALPCHQH